MTYDPSLFSYDVDDPAGGRSPADANRRQPRKHDAVGRHQPVLRLGAGPPPGHEYHQSVLYEAHVKGLTMPHPDVPEQIRGTYAGIAHPATIAHLRDLGVTAVELMPVHQFVRRLPPARPRASRNYWGYNTIGFFAPHNAYAA